MPVWLIMLKVRLKLLWIKAKNKLAYELSDPAKKDIVYMDTRPVDYQKALAPYDKMMREKHADKPKRNKASAKVTMAKRKKQAGKAPKK